MLIKQNFNIKGIVINNTEHTDDTSVILDGSLDSLFYSLDTIDFFFKILRTEINSSKTKVVWIGSKQFSNQVFHHTRWKLDWECTTFILLGIEFSVKLNEVTEFNFNLELPKVSNW